MEDKEAVTRIGVGSTVIIAGFLVGAVFHYVVKILLARLLGPESYGVFVQGMAVAEAVTLLSLFGLQLSIPRFMSFYRGRDESEFIQKTVSTSFLLALPATFVGAVALFLASEWLATAVFSEPALVEPLKLLSLTVVPLGAVYLFISLFRGLQNAKYKVYLDDFIFSGLLMGSLVLFYFIGLDVERAIYAYLAAEIVTVVAGYYLFRKLYDGSLLSGTGKMSRRLLSFSWPLFIVSMLVTINNWIDVVLIGWLMESARVGIYNVAYSIAAVLAFVLTSLGYFFMPVVSELYAEDRIAEIREVYRTCVRWVVAAAAPLFAGIILFPEDILSLLFGASYLPAAIPLMLLGGGFFARAATGPSGLTLLAAGKPKIQMIGIGAITVVNVAMGLLLIPSFGIVGAAVSTLMALISGHLLLLYLASKEIEGFPYNRRIIKVLGSVFIAALPVYGLKLLLDPEPILSFFLGITLLTIYGITLLLLDGFSEEDREIFWELVGFVR